MITLQEAGKQILSGNPNRFYIFCGEDFGIKRRYLQSIIDTYGGKFQICDTVDSVLNLMSHKHLIPLEPKAYVVKYDELFISNLSEKYAKKCLESKIIGTLVVFMENEKHCKKCDKYLPECSIDFVKTNPKFVFKYLADDYASLVPEDVIRSIVDMCGDYNSANIVCEIVSRLPNSSAVTLEDISKFYYNPDSSDAKILKQFISGKKFGESVEVLDRLPNYESAYYAILSALLDLEKSDNSSWSKEDIVNMYNQVYNQIALSRKYTINIYDSVVYLLALMRFGTVPSVEIMKC